MVPIASAVEEELVAVARSLFHNDRDGPDGQCRAQSC